MARAARAMATATKKAMATNGNNLGYDYGEEAGGQVATMAMGMLVALIDMQKFVLDD
jgi:hypothetical protein